MIDPPYDSVPERSFRWPPIETETCGGVKSVSGLPPVFLGKERSREGHKGGNSDFDEELQRGDGQDLCQTRSSTRGSPTPVNVVARTPIALASRQQI